MPKGCRWWNSNRSCCGHRRPVASTKRHRFPSRSRTARRTAAGMWREAGEVSVFERSLRGRLVVAKRRASSRASFSLTAASMIAPRSPSGTCERMRAWSRSSFSASPALAVNCTLYRPGARGWTTGGGRGRRTCGVDEADAGPRGSSSRSGGFGCYRLYPFRTELALRGRLCRSRSAASSSGRAERWPSRSGMLMTRSKWVAGWKVIAECKVIARGKVIARPESDRRQDTPLRSGSFRIRAGTSSRGATSAISSSIWRLDRCVARLRSASRFPAVRWGASWAIPLRWRRPSLSIARRIGCSREARATAIRR